ncbi:pyridoxal phosphate-dependent aminotransferase [Desulfuromonas thiophila]|uniref:alanine transaminase n=1 Tax=Desulfuromonas thiophila TaxID=57664 RepID=A0A1G7DE34_9BACT|nr:pyridoxal phosphate-dependent aminotransferase [Desulfuromonas thiophila]MCK9173096.1 pyridoxal phosphate-dependent aminotransferase [Desulfuromonas thiophila]MDD3802317.1 pyridoxal phosphate-dependent aminotransferase [Desulfuromonas thiophila]MDY0398721.1 pyridoxal phosphate-dependent aminotransferase [Desulfuromonas thiophila]SDE49868.1 Aspartate/methionine/tyrosine aminotransferase [Desulfuromonas thiophila]
MRNNIVHIGAGELTYEIRAIVEIAEKLNQLGIKTNMENIGDPIAKGERIPQWMKKIVADLAMKDCSYGYCATKGVLETRQFLAERTNRRGKAQITPEDIIFFNGLGDAIQKVYGFLKREARVIGPSPTYSTHSSGEAAHAGQAPVSYRLDPDNHWYPDLDDLRLSVKYNPAICGLLIINPDNPTGAVYPERVLVEMIKIAKEYDLFIICDEIYHNIIYNGESTKPISDLIGDVPAIAMKGISKDLPWPGSRCGWIEVYNRDKDPMFKRYIQSIFDAKMVEVCSTTLPQKAIPLILSHEQYPVYLKERTARYERCSNIAYDILKQVPGIKVNRTNGAFYMSVAFDRNLLNDKQSLPIANPEVRALVESLVAAPGTLLDKRFVYYLLGATGICVVPLSSFSTAERGFRITLLERDEQEFTQIFHTIAESIQAYLAS